MPFAFRRAFGLAVISAASVIAIASGAVAEDTVASLLPKADAAAGKAKAAICLTCHSVDKGAANKIGPNLWGIVDKPIASASGYTYSTSMQGKKADKWTVENLDQYLAAPAAFAKGNKMAFAGVKNVQERANIIAWLKTLADKK